MPTLLPVLAVLDDEAELRKALRRLLTGRGYVVEEYADGHDLLADLALRPPDSLLLDLHMEGVSGFEVLASFRSRGIDMPVIVITADDQTSTATRVRALGAFACLRKPVDRDVLFNTLDAALTDPLGALSPGEDGR